MALAFTYMFLTPLRHMSRSTRRPLRCFSMSATTPQRTFVGWNPGGNTHATMRATIMPRAICITMFRRRATRCARDSMPAAYAVCLPPRYDLHAPAFGRATIGCAACAMPNGMLSINATPPNAKPLRRFTRTPDVVNTVM